MSGHFVVSSLVWVGTYRHAQAQISAEEYPTWEGAVMDQHLRELAGPEAVDCGRVRVRESPDRATQCAFRAFQAQRPFYVRYDIQGIDSAVAGGLAAATVTKVYAVEFDSMGWASDGFPKTSKLSSDRHLITTPCPKPVKLIKNGSGRLTCFPPGPKSRPTSCLPNAELF